MMDQTQLAVLINDIKHIRKDAEEIKEQVLKTNGRVTGLEKFRAMLVGMWLATVVIVSVVWALVQFFA